ncbi:MAG TPA: phosphoribosylaminoimidazolesuccinocarboxamide synthase [Drouetiella sp.]
MNLTRPESLKLAYEGSVKRVYDSPDQTDTLWFEFTDDYSVFDWGKMPDTIAHKGRALALMGGYFFKRLSDKQFWQALPSSPHLRDIDQNWLKDRWAHTVYTRLTNAGVPTHFKSLAQASAPVTDYKTAASRAEAVLMEVLKASVFRPQPRNITGNTIYFYENDVTASPRLIPLEIVFRFGMPAGSSLIERLEKDPGYVHALGLKERPQPNSFFPHPVIELYTKLEPKDRLLSYQEAALMADLDGETFEEMIELATDIALGLYVIFAERSIELWDGKVEMILADGEPVLADSIGPDELRLIHKGAHLSKEMIRQIYRGSVWETAIKDAQTRAKILPNKGWKHICKVDLGAEPEPLSASDKKIVDQLYAVIANHIIGEQVFADQPSLDEYVKSMPTKSDSTWAGKTSSRQAQAGARKK